ncbi:MAG: hypothetical protein ABIJ04_02945 [Bacteroidota bacterium]
MLRKLFEEQFAVDRVDDGNHVRYSLFAIRYSLFAIRYSLFAIRCSLFAIRYSLLLVKIIKKMPSGFNLLTRILINSMFNHEGHEGWHKGHKEVFVI